MSKYVSNKSLKYAISKLVDKLSLKTFHVSTFTQSKQTDVQPGTSWTIIPFDTNNNPTDKLIIQSNGTIKIGKGVNRIVVSGACSLSTIDNYDLRRAAILKNNTVLNRSIFYLTSYHSFSLSPVTVDVKENDIIALKFNSDRAKSCTIPAGSKEVCYLTIMIVG